MKTIELVAPQNTIVLAILSNCHFICVFGLTMAVPPFVISELLPKDLSLLIPPSYFPPCHTILVLRGQKKQDLSGVIEWYQCKFSLEKTFSLKANQKIIEFLPLQKLWRPRCIKFYDFRPGFLSLPYFSSVPIYVVEGIRNSIACKKGHRAWHNQILFLYQF